ncbi:MAG: hypothetical protein ACM3X1_06565 [Ignavibacteriales bacterium]
MSNYIPRLTMIGSILLVLFLLVTFTGNLVSAQSPSFVRQEITDGNDDFNFLDSTDDLTSFASNRSKLFYAEPAVEESECELENYTLPDIRSVSFVSDGAMLNSTFWLNQAFVEPSFTNYEGSPFVNDSMIHQEFLEVYVYPANNKTVEQVIDQVLKNLTQNNVVKDLERSITDIAGINATNITSTMFYNGTLPYYFGNSTSKASDILFIHNNTVYELLYEAEVEQFDKGLPNFQKMVSSFHINEVTDSSSNYNSPPTDKDNYSTYSNTSYGITLQYPSDWRAEETFFSNENVITFLSPIQGPYLDYVGYGVKVFVVPVYQSTELLEGYIRYTYWDSNNQTWIESLSDQSSNSLEGGQARIIYEKPTEGFFRENENWINVPLGLHNINSPSEYQATFFEDIGFVKDGRYCYFIDPTNLISAPPPKFSITSNPLSPINIGPNEEKVVEIKIQSSSDIVSNASLSVENIGEDIKDAYFMSDKIEIPESGWAIAQLVIKGSTNYFNPTHPKTLDIVATISSGSSTIHTAGGGAYTNNVAPSPIEETSALTLNVLSLYDYMLGGFSALNSSGAVTIIISIVTFVVGFLSKEKLGGLLNSIKGGNSGSNDSKSDKQG